VPRSKSKDDDSSVEQVITHIRSCIVSGKYPADTKLLPKLIADQCGTSFIPVREAMRALESEGLVAYIHNRGVWVTPLSKAINCCVLSAIEAASSVGKDKASS